MDFLSDHSFEALVSPCFKSDYSSAAVNISQVQVPPENSLFIGGEYRKSEGSPSYENRCPFDRKISGKVANARELDVNAAIENSQAAYRNGWGSVSGFERSSCLFRLAYLISRNADELSALEALGIGKPISLIKHFDLVLAEEVLTYYAGWADKIRDETVSSKSDPVGICALIMSSSALLTHVVSALAQALACGNALIIKASFSSPFFALRLGRLCKEAGFPDGVVNVVTGDGLTESLLASHPSLDLVSAIGQLSHSEEISRLGSNFHVDSEIKPIANTCMIVFSDSEIDQIVDGMINIFFLQESYSYSRNRFFIEESMFELFLEKIKRRLLKLRIGNPLDLNTEIACHQSRSMVLQAEAAISKLKAEGFQCFRLPGPCPEEGTSFFPVLVSGLASVHSVSFADLLGDGLVAPILGLFSFNSLDEVIQSINDTPGITSAGVWSPDGSIIDKVSKALNCKYILSHSFKPIRPNDHLIGQRSTCLSAYLKVSQ